jgi:hypothetical protein
VDPRKKRGLARPRRAEVASGKASPEVRLGIGEESVFCDSSLAPEGDAALW